MHPIVSKETEPYDDFMLCVTPPSKKALNAMKEFSQSCQGMIFSDKCPTEVEASPSLWMSPIISRGGTAGSREEVSAAMSSVPRQGKVGGSTAGNCGEVPAAMSGVPRQGEVGGSTAGNCGEVPAAMLGMPRQGEVGDSATGSCEEVPATVSGVLRGG